jgi:hypothetical protein
MFKGIRRRRPSPALIVSLLALVFAMGGFAMAAIPDSSGVFHGCYKKKKGTLRVVSSSRKCKKSERSISWNQKGQAGANGANGATGAKGDKGDAGDPATNLWASIDGDPATPTILRGSGATAVSHFGGTGQFKVSFDRDVRDCAWLATVGDGTTDAGWGTTLGRTISTSFASGFANPNEVMAETSTGSGTLVNQDFFIAVFC